MRRIPSAGTFALVGALLACAGTARATPLIEIGDLEIAAAPDQQIQIFVRGGDLVEAFDLYVQIGDGGVNNSDGTSSGVDAGPKITSVDLVTGTIFEANSAGQADPGLNLPDLMASFAIYTLSGAVEADGLLATITLDATGFAGGALALRLTNVADLAFGGLDTGFAVGGNALPASFDIGTITVVPAVPEPATLGLILAGIGAFGPTISARTGATRARRSSLRT